MITSRSPATAAPTSCSSRWLSTLDILGDSEAVADLRQSKEDFASGDTYTAAQVRAELEQRRRLGMQ
jgi:hypothetical protein